eukprot:1142864-Pelagomonas_calceolata.AAC.2
MSCLPDFGFVSALSKLSKLLRMTIFLLRVTFVMLKMMCRMSSMLLSNVHTASASSQTVLYLSSTPPGCKRLSFRSTNNWEGEAATVRAHQPPTTQHQYHPTAAGAAAPGQNIMMGGAVKKVQAASADQESRAQARKIAQAMKATGCLPRRLARVAMGEETHVFLHLPNTTSYPSEHGALYGHFKTKYRRRASYSCRQFQHLFSSAPPTSASRPRDFMNQADVLGLAKHVLLQLSCPRRQ